MLCLDVTRMLAEYWTLRMYPGYEMLAGYFQYLYEVAKIKCFHDCFQRTCNNILNIFITLLFFLLDVLSLTYTGQQTFENIFKQIEHLFTPSFLEYLNRWERRIGVYCLKLLLSNVWKNPNNCNNKFGHFKQPHIRIENYSYWTPSLQSFRYGINSS